MLGHILEAFPSDLAPEVRSQKSEVRSRMKRTRRIELISILTSDSCLLAPDFGFRSRVQTAPTHLNQALLFRRGQLEQIPHQQIRVIAFVAMENWRRRPVKHPVAFSLLKQTR